MEDKNLILNVIDEKIFDYLRHFKDVMPLRLTKLIANYYPDARIRKLYFEKLGVYMGEGTYANLGLKITVGKLKEKYMIVIGNNVSIAPNVTLIADSIPNNSMRLQNHPYVKEKLIINEKIIINDDVWLGSNVTILPGIIIGECSIIGAGSVVVSDVEAYSVYAGVPARKVRSLEGDESHV